MFSSKFAVCDSKKSRFVKKQEPIRLNDLILKRPLSKFTLLGDILF